jgi:NTP pyrophosphatase (non-canonical NTP hydrolase)
MNIIADLQKRIILFRNKRRWKKFHKPKDLAISLCLEANELLELFQWKNNKEIKDLIKNNKKAMSDVLYWILLMAYDFKIDLVKEFLEKMEENEKKYPVSKSKGKHTKYNNL